ncbi:PD-(D/E)XK nuclease family protein [bacterium]|nr:PD-(D/E)XK nuclease family protein [bacterium]
MFSPNMLKTFQTCPYKYWFKYTEQIPVPQKTSFFEKGKRIHALANYYLRGDDISKLEKALNSEERTIWEQLKNNEYFKMSYVNSEYNLSCKVGEYWIGGRLDAVVKNFTKDLPPHPQGEGVEYFILDYKTGSIPKEPEYDFQTMVYLLALRKSLKISAEISFVYIDLKKKQNHLIKLTTPKKEEYEQAIIKICDEITNFTLKENTEHSKKCEFCEYKKICI